MGFEQTLQKIANVLRELDFIDAVVLGGSRATGTAGAESDIDIGVYYQKERLEYDALNAAAQKLDDQRRTNLICREGQWGPFVNCGGWLMVDGMAVDLILRDTARVRDMVAQAQRGQFCAQYQTGHPHAYVDIMYRGELACSSVLYARDTAFIDLKKQAQTYPESLRTALVDFFVLKRGFRACWHERTKIPGICVI